MNRCANGHEVAKGAVFCPTCGVPVDPRATILVSAVAEPLLRNESQIPHSEGREKGQHRSRAIPVIIGLALLAGLGAGLVVALGSSASPTSLGSQQGYLDVSSNRVIWYTWDYTSGRISNGVMVEIEPSGDCVFGFVGHVDGAAVAFDYKIGSFQVGISNSGHFAEGKLVVDGQSASLEHSGSFNRAATALNSDWQAQRKIVPAYGCSNGASP